MTSAYNSYWWARMLGPRPAHRCVAASKSSEVTRTWPPWPPFLVDAAQHTAQCGTPESRKAHSGTEPHNTHQSSTRECNA